MFDKKLLNYKAYNHHTLHCASPWCTELAGTLTRDLDLYFMLQWLLHILRQRSIIIGLHFFSTQFSK